MEELNQSLNQPAELHQEQLFHTSLKLLHMAELNHTLTAPTLPQMVALLLMFQEPQYMVDTPLTLLTHQSQASQPQAHTLFPMVTPSNTHTLPPHQDTRLLSQPSFQLQLDSKPMLTPSLATVDHHHTNRLPKLVRSADAQPLLSLKPLPMEELNQSPNTPKKPHTGDQRLFTALLLHTVESQLKLLLPTPPEMEELKPSAQEPTPADNRPTHLLSHQPVHHTSHPPFHTHHQTVDQ